MRCVYCGFENEPDATFCIRCGKSTARVCAKCGANLPEGSIFCPSCGFQNAAAPVIPSVSLPKKHRKKALWIIGSAVFLIAAAVVLLLLVLPGASSPASSGLLSTAPKNMLIAVTEDDGDTVTLYYQDLSGGKRVKIDDNVTPDAYFDIAAFQSVAYINENDMLYLYRNNQKTKIDTDVTAIRVGGNPSRLTLFYEKDGDAYMYQDGADPKKLPFDIDDLSSGTALYNANLGKSDYSMSPLAFAVEKYGGYLNYQFNEKGFIVASSGSIYFYDLQSGEKNKVVSDADNLVGGSRDLTSIAYIKDDKFYIVWDISSQNPDPIKYSVSDPLFALFKNNSEAFVLEEDTVTYIKKGSNNTTEIDLGVNVNSCFGISSDQTKLYFISEDYDLYMLNIGGGISENLKKERIASDIEAAFQFEGDSSVFAFADDDDETVYQIDGNSKKTVKNLTADFTFINKNIAYDYDNGELIIVNVQDGTKKTLSDDVDSYKVVSTADNGMILYITYDGDLYVARGTEKTKLDFDAEDVYRIQCNFMSFSPPEQEAATASAAPATTAVPAVSEAPAVATEEIRTLKIGYVGPPQSINGLQMISEGLASFADKNQQIELIVTDGAEYDNADKLFQITESLLASGVDGIIFLNYFPIEVGESLMMMVREAGVAAVVINGSAYAADFVINGSDPEMFYEQMAYRFAELVDFKGEVAIGGTSYGMQWLPVVKTVLSEYPEIKIVGEYTTSYNLEESTFMASAMLGENPDIQGFLSLDAPTCQGVTEAVKTAGLSNKIVTFGLHAMSMITRDDLKSPLASYFIEDLKQTGFAAGVLMDRMLNGETIYDGMDLGIDGFHAIHIKDNILAGENWVEINNENYILYMGF